MKKLDLVGERFINNQGEEGVVIQYINNKNVLIEFQEFKCQKWFELERIREGIFKNPFAPSVYKVGITGNIKDPSNHYLYSRWSSMLSRCYNKEHPQYKDYGGKGISVSGEWLYFENYIKDIESMENYEKLLLGWEIDKDKSGKNYYGKDSCEIISKKENATLSNEKIIIQYNKEGEILREFNSVKEASDFLEVKSSSNISQCLTGKQKTAYGFVWKYK